jgi:hypothetical protein
MRPEESVISLRANKTETRYNVVWRELVPRFTVRVELHAADDDDYETLHGAMKTEGFSRRITSGDGITYHLPTAEYNREADLTKEDILESAKRAAAKTSRKAAILVTESNGRIWSGLDKV